MKTLSSESRNETFYRDVMKGYYGQNAILILHRLFCRLFCRLFP